MSPNQVYSERYRHPFFDRLIWVFGDVVTSQVKELKGDFASGYIQLKQARVTWTLSINENDVPQEMRAKGKRTYRSLKMDGTEIEFSDGFTELHTISYKHILEGKGFGLDEARPSVNLVHAIRNLK
jgi:UDP-N-acetyl-2-amino-2-deoxyglucuronate dehydrogenase